MDYFYELSDSSQLLQGDVFKIGNNCDDIFHEEEQLSVIITADCDIAQQKMQNTFTLLPIISVQSYLENHWIPSVFKKKEDKINLELSNIIKKSEIVKTSNCNLPSADDIAAWLNEESLEKICSRLSIDLNNRKNGALRNKYNILISGGTIENYKKLRGIDNAKKETIEKELVGAVKDCREEFFHIPNMLDSSYGGYIVKLRNVRAVHCHRVFSTYHEVRLSQIASNEALVRIGRFSDFLRYSIAQKFALLFSRIGMPEFFEEDAVSSLNKLCELTKEI